MILTYTGAFHLGDIVKINETTGEVISKSLLATKLRTFKNENVSIPNSLTLNNAVMNYSSAAKTKGLIIHTEVTIGYDAPWQQVHALLIAAAQATPEILRTPAPYVLQTALNDYNVSYQLNAFTATPEHLPSLYSQLHQNIQDKFNGAGVEIMSPFYAAVRDGNTITIPENYRGKDYSAPGFRVTSTASSNAKVDGLEIEMSAPAHEADS